MFTLNKSGIMKSIGALSLAALMAFASVLTVAAGVNGAKNLVNGKAAFESIEALVENGEKIHRSCEVTIENGDETKTLTILGGTVADCLKAADVTVGEKQVVAPALDSKITADTVIRVLDAKTVKLTADGKTKDVLLPYGKVGESLALAGIELGSEDILSVDKSTPVKEIKKLTIQRVTYKDEYVTEKVNYKTVEETSDKVPLGETKVKTEGKKGEKVVVKHVKYVDGKKKSSKTIAEKITKKPTDKVVLIGTKGAATSGGAGTFTDSNGVTVAYDYVLTGSGTAYTAPAGSLTATGNKVYQGGVAVNPNLIPYGSKLYIVSTDGSFVYGYATAIDTGGALMDGTAIVDCFYFTYDECCQFGRRDVNVYVLK